MRAPLLCLLVLCVALVAAKSKRDTSHIKYVHVIFMNHLDVGFDGIDPIIGFAYNVINKYFDIYFPAALNTSAYLRATYPNGPYRLVYTTHPWLLAMYFNCPSNTTWGSLLHCPNASAIAALQTGIADGTIAWHAFPFNTEPELADPSLIEFGISMAQDLDAQYGQDNSMTMSQRDVPGLTRGMVPILAKNGVKALSVGVNGASAPPGVPSIFIWRDVASNTEIIGHYHPGGYGGINVSDCVVLGNFEHALCMDFNGDNAGPQNITQVVQAIQQMQAEFPNAQIVPGTWDNWTSIVLAAQGSNNSLGLPVYTGEIGDTWIHGAQSDPLKVMWMREVMRIRTACIASGECDVNNPAMKRFDRLFIKVIEHTWGLDVKTFLADWVNWTNAQLQAAMPDANYQLMIQSWIEQRQFFNSALEELAVGYPALAAQINASLASFTNIQPPSTAGWTPVTQLATVFNIGQYQLQFGPSGSVSYLLDPKNDVQWASPANQLGAYVYQTLSETDQNAFMAEYLYCDYLTTCPWASGDFGKPNMSLANPISAKWYPKMTQLFEQTDGNVTSLLVHMVMLSNLTKFYGAPTDVWLRVDGALGSSQLNFTFTLVNKTATRLAEAHWVVFNPPAESLANWTIDKLGSEICPLDVMTNGSHHIHGFLSGLTYMSDEASISITSIDAGLVSVGMITPYPTPIIVASDVDGFAFNLFNNVWGTNYIMWYPFLPQDASIRYRFSIDLEL